MFSVNNKKENGFDIVVLTDQVSGTSVEIIPECGAIIHAFRIIHEQDNLNIIEQYDNKKQFDDEVEAAGFKSCKLSPFPCRLKDGLYNFGEKEYKIEQFYLGKHALHGLIYNAPFDIVKMNSDTERASVELLHAYKATDKGFPFKYDCRVIYELEKENKLTITTVVKNNESYAIPMADGWHPYFSFGGAVNDLHMSIQAREMLEFDEELIPTKKKLPYNEFITMKEIGSTLLDNSFLVEPKLNTPVLILKDSHKQLQLEIIPDKSYPILQVYIPAHRKSIAIENLSSAPDAFNNQINLCVVPAGNEAIFKTSFRISKSN